MKGKKVIVVSSLLVVLLVPFFRAYAAEATGTWETETKTNQLTNPLGEGNTDLKTLAITIGNAIRDLAIPVAVIMIIWIGIQFLTANGNPEKITKARSALLWVCIGLAIIFIGGGFISLVKDILNLKQ